jgi:hypothetical protein
VAGVGVRIGQATPKGAGGASRHGDIKARRYAVGVVRANDDEVPLHTGGSPFRQRSPPSAVIAELRASGVTSLRVIAAALNERGIPTSAGTGRWYHTQVGRLLERLAK